jgi:hypothetical protein
LLFKRRNNFNIKKKSVEATFNRVLFHLHWQLLTNFIQYSAFKIIFKKITWIFFFNLKQMYNVVTTAFEKHLIF